MRIPSFLSALTLLGTAAWAQGDSSPYYFQFGVGGVFSDDATGVQGNDTSFDPGFSITGALGRHFPLSESWVFDLELEGYYQSFTVEAKDLARIPSAVDDNATALAFLVNGLLEWRFTEQFWWYFGGGIGYAKDITYQAWDSGSLNQLDTDGLAYQGRFGFGYNFGGNTDVLLGYRYFHTDPVGIENLITNEVDDIDIGQHSIEATFRWAL